MSAIKVIRSISHEIRKGLPQKERVSSSPLMQLVMSQARTHDVTTERTCNSAKDMEMMGQLYTCYLRSTREYMELQEKYRSKEGTVEQAAHRVGLQLPKTFQPEK